MGELGRRVANINSGLAPFSPLDQHTCIEIFSRQYRAPLFLIYF